MDTRAFCFILNKTFCVHKKKRIKNVRHTFLASAQVNGRCVHRATPRPLTHASHTPSGVLWIHSCTSTASSHFYVFVVSLRKSQGTHHVDHYTRERVTHAIWCELGAESKSYICSGHTNLNLNTVPSSPCLRVLELFHTFLKREHLTHYFNSKSTSFHAKLHEPSLRRTVIPTGSYRFYILEVKFATVAPPKPNRSRECLANLSEKKVSAPERNFGKECQQIANTHENCFSGILNKNFKFQLRISDA